MSNPIAPPEPQIYLNSTLAYCADCGATEMARIMASEEGVFMERVCPKKGASRTKIARDPAWYSARMMPSRAVQACTGAPSSLPLKPVERGCPFDCGPCQWHSGKLFLPVFSITNDCNLDCPICFTYNRPDQKYFKTIQETEAILTHILAHAGGSVQLINLTGGEPTLHPQLFDILKTCQRAGIGRVTMNTNGIRLAGDKRFAEQIKASGVQVVLSLDTFDPEKSVLIHGKDITKAKRKCLAHLEALDIPTTILPVCIKGCNEDDVREIVHDMIRKPFVRSITVQNMTFTGANGAAFQPHEHITLDEVEALLALRPGIKQSDFFAPASYHPMCYSAAYYLVHGDTLISLADLLGRETLAAMSAGAYLIDPQRDFADEFRAGLHRLWGNGAEEDVLTVLRRFLDAVYPRDQTLRPIERQAVLERWVKMLLIHPHMDRDNFDIARVSACGDLVPDEKGSMIPACAYNLLYRQKDARFWLEPNQCQAPRLDPAKVSPITFS